MSDLYETKEQLREYILRKLGGCNVAVELSPEQVDDAINDSLDTFNSLICRCDPRVASNRTGAVQIPLLPGDRGIVECKICFPEDYRIYAQMNIFEIMYRMVFPRMPLGDWAMLKIYYEQYQKVRGTDPDWYLSEDSATGAPVLYVDCWSGPYDIFYVVATDLTVESIAKLKSAYTRDFRKLAVAEAKITLSRIRGKFGNSIPVPGGTLNTDAESLRSEGMQEKQEVVDKLEKIARFTSSPVMWG
jgi:hypothetical protein